MGIVNMKKIISSLAAVAALGWSAFVFAEVAVIVHPSVEHGSLTRAEVSRLFLGKSKSFPNGMHAVAVNQDEGSAVREKFIADVCEKSPSQYKAYWSRLVFTGKGVAPRDAGDDVAVKSMVASNPKMIGYVDASVVDATVKVVFTLP